MKKVVTIGLGYIGLPTSALIASNKLNVFGVDINQKVVDTINDGKIHIVEPDLEKYVKNAVNQGFLKAGTSVVMGDVYLIVVPTPFKENHEPDISFVQNATESIIPLLKEDDLYIIESTSPVGTTEKMRDLIYSSRPELLDRIYMAYCPERVLPGNVMYELVHNDRVIGGVDDKSTSMASKFYSQFVKGQLHKTNARTAEMCKLTENASRDVQIAFANELSMICEKAKIDVSELIDLANKHPRVSILQPGCGVGGHCIAVDPYFITSSFPAESKLIAKARKVNNYKAEWVINDILSKIERFKSDNNRTPSIGLFGLAFKPNIDDLRESPAVFIAKALKKSNLTNDLFFVEPNITNHKDFEITDLNAALQKTTLNFILVAHEEFKNTAWNPCNTTSYVNLK